MQDSSSSDIGVYIRRFSIIDRKFKKKLIKTNLQYAVRGTPQNTYLTTVYVVTLNDRKLFMKIINTCRTTLNSIIFIVVYSTFSDATPVAR